MSRSCGISAALAVLFADNNSLTALPQKMILEAILGLTCDSGSSSNLKKN